jgi:hypothetical protein
MSLVGVIFSKASWSRAPRVLHDLVGKRLYRSNEPCPLNMLSMDGTG